MFRRTKRVTVWGETKTLVEWFNDPRCVLPSIQHLYSRRSQGWEMERALSTPVTPKDSLLTAWGESKTICEWAKDPRCQVSEAGLRKRLHEDWPIEQAVAQPKWIRRHPDKEETD